jgi:hypothetical protein
MLTNINAAAADKAYSPAGAPSQDFGKMRELGHTI